MVLALLGVLVACAATAGIAAGSIGVPADEVWSILLHRVHPALAEPGLDAAARETIVVDVRLPRVLLGRCRRRGLSVARMALQALVRNPLADPFLLGVSSGAPRSARARPGVTSVFGLFTCRWPPSAGALAALVAVYFLARSGGGMTTVRLVLAGVAIAECFRRWPAS